MVTPKMYDSVSFRHNATRVEQSLKLQRIQNPKLRSSALSRVCRYSRTGGVAYPLASFVPDRLLDDSSAYQISCHLELNHTHLSRRIDKNLFIPFSQIWNKKSQRRVRRGGVTFTGCPTNLQGLFSFVFLFLSLSVSLHRCTYALYPYTRLFFYKNVQILS